jgi:glucosamine-6-phosphate deaminase
METVAKTSVAPVRNFTAGKLQVNIYESRSSMGSAAAQDAADNIKNLLSSRPGFVNVIFAAAPSQNEFLLHLSKTQNIDWSRVNAFHMDEYVGIDQSSPRSFASFLRTNIFEKVPLNKIYYIDGSASDSAGECERYAALITDNPPDIVCMGIGENTHIAFNDPHTADFNDPLLVKLVTLDEASRQQQVHDGCFPDLSAVPTSAITLTVPALLQAKSIYCIVPGKNKATAVFQTINSGSTEKYPSTSLKTHPAAILYLDAESSEKLQ